MKRLCVVTGAFLLCLAYSFNPLAPLSPAMALEKNSAHQLREYFEEGTKAYHEGRYAQAIEYYEKVVEIDPDFAPVYNVLGLTHREMNARLSDIMWFFKEAVAIDPKYAPAHNNMCKMYYQLGDYDKAEGSCLKAVSSDPSLGQAQLTLAWIYLVGKSQPGQAVHYFNQVLKKVQKPRIYFGLGVAHSLKGDHAQVLDIITILRGLNEDEMAAQLESALLPDGKPELFTKFIPLPRRQSGKLIPAASPKIRRPAAGRAGKVPAESSADELMRVRLKGKLRDIGGGSPAAPETPSESSASPSPWSKNSPFLPK